MLNVQLFQCCFIKQHLAAILFMVLWALYFNCGAVCETEFKKVPYIYIYMSVCVFVCVLMYVYVCVCVTYMNIIKSCIMGAGKVKRFKKGNPGVRLKINIVIWRRK